MIIERRRSRRKNDNRASAKPPQKWKSYVTAQINQLCFFSHYSVDHKCWQTRMVKNENHTTKVELFKLKMALVRFSFLNHALYCLYEGRSICNENSSVYPKVLYLHTS